jgi:hypothetical protein
MLEIGKSGLMSGEEKRVKSIPRSFSTPPNFGLFPFFLGLYELGMHAEEGPVGGGVVADEESEVLGDGEIAIFEHLDLEDMALKTEGAEAQPLVGGHFFDEDLFGVDGGLIFSDQTVDESVEFVGVLAGNDGGVGGEAVRKMVHGGDGFAFGSFGSAPRDGTRLCEFNLLASIWRAVAINWGSFLGWVGLDRLFQFHCKEGAVTEIG